MKNFFKNLKEVKKNPRGEAFLFFGFYFVFFLVLILFLRGGHKNKNNINNYDYDEPINLLFDGSKLEKNNYSFNYKVILDGVNHEYIGKKNNDEMFLYLNNQYYHHDNDFYIKKDNWEKVVNPYMFSDFFNIEKLFILINNGYLESETNYNSGKINYNMLISTNTINQILYNIDSDYSEIPNSVVVSKNEKSIINQIHFSLDSFCKLDKMCNKSLEIIISYDNIGEIEEINNPIIN